MKIIFDYNRTLFNPELNELYPGARELLRRLHARHELFLVSRFEQERITQLETLDIRQYFQDVAFVPDKTEEIFIGLVGTALDVMVIGDSITDEIRIGNILGYVTIRIQQGKFSGQVPASKEQTAKHCISSLEEIEPLLKHYEK